jgi:hypothetical protein
MGASINDICLTVVSNGETAYYSSFKAMGHILWDVNCGLFSDNKPKAHYFFDFLKKGNTTWDFEDVVKLNEPLEKPVYGIITVDFDKKEIVDDNGYGDLIVMFFQWFSDSIKSTQDNRSGYVSNKSVKYHLAQGNIVFLKRDNKVHSVLPSSLEESLKLIQYYEDNIEAKMDEEIMWIGIKLPQGWKYNGHNGR